MQLPILILTSLMLSASPPKMSKSEVLETAKELADEMDMPSDSKSRVMHKLKKVLKKLSKKRGVQGVMAYRLGEGGLVVKFLKGKGLIKFKGEKKAKRVRFKATSFGAQVGGSSEQGIALITRIEDVAHFGGIYEGSKKGAVALDTGGKISRMQKDDIDEEHDIYFVGASKGLSAGVATAKLTITVQN